MTFNCLLWSNNDHFRLLSVHPILFPGIGTDLEPGARNLAACFASHKQSCCFYTNTWSLSSSLFREVPKPISSCHLVSTLPSLDVNSRRPGKQIGG